MGEMKLPSNSSKGSFNSNDSVFIQEKKRIYW